MYICVYTYVNNYDIIDIYVYIYRHKAGPLASYKIVVLSEYQVCREILWMIYVQTSMVVFQQESGSRFSIRPNTSIPSLTTVCMTTECPMMKGKILANDQGLFS